MEIVSQTVTEENTIDTEVCAFEGETVTLQNLPYGRITINSEPTNGSTTSIALAEAR